MTGDGSELRVSDAQACAAAVYQQVLSDFLLKKRPLELAVRNWMIENAQGTATARTDFEEAVRWILDPE